jgi:hypothetical protein
MEIEENEVRRVGARTLAEPLSASLGHPVIRKLFASALALGSALGSAGNAAAVCGADYVGFKKGLMASILYRYNATVGIQRFIADRVGRRVPAIISLPQAGRIGFVRRSVGIVRYAIRVIRQMTFQVKLIISIGETVL